MLVAFRVGNYRSFHEPQTLCLLAGRDRSLPGNLIRRNEENLLKVAAIYGANASGKSNLVKAMGVMWYFVRNSATRMNVGDEIDVIVPFRLDADSRNQPSLFEIKLIVGGVFHQYGFTATRRRVHDEWLHAYPFGRRRRLFERRFDPATGKTRWRLASDLKKVGDLLTERTRDNGLLLSRGAELNVEQLIPVFREITENVWVFDLSDDFTMYEMMQKTAARFREDVSVRDYTTRLLQDADLGIEDIRVTEIPVRPTRLPKETSEGFTDGQREFVERSRIFRVETVHAVTGTAEKEVFNLLGAESNGTQKLFALAGLWSDALQSGKTVVLDELDCSMHPLMTRGLIELFQDEERNNTGAQLVLATHDSTLLSPTLFRRDQIWLLEKGADQASELYSLFDFDHKPRKNEAIEKGYLAGRYGGTPTLGATFEDVQFR